ncbi:MAG: TonB-dependent receptor [Pseudomonadota bacterium]
MSTDLRRAKLKLFRCLGIVSLGMLAGEANSQQLEEVLVYGQKAERSLMDTTASVAILSEAQMRDLNLTDLNDVYRITPNVNIDDASSGNFLIRGISYLGVGFSGVSNTAALYVDDIFQSNLGIEAGPQSTFDVRQVEIFRGPQSTLQGRNALAGAILVRTNDPGYAWEGRARVELADYDTRRYSLAGGGPIVDDVLAFRLAADYRETDGYIDNTTLNRDDLDSDEATIIRGKLRWDPSDQLQALFTYIYADGNSGNGIAAGAVEGPDYFAREVTGPNATLREVETDNYALAVRYALSDATSIEWVTSYTDATEDTQPRFRVDPETSTGGEVGVETEDILTSDLRVRFASGDWGLLGGLYYFEREQALDFALSARLSLGPLATTINAVESSRTEVENIALYFDGEYAFSERMSLVFGARYDEERFDLVSRTSTIFDPEVPPVAVSTIGASLAADTRFDAFLPKLGLRYDLTDDQTLGFVVQRGYRPGGAGASLSNIEYSFDPEYLWSYELSYRSNWLDRRLQLNANVYFMDWEDQQVIIGQDVDRVVVNAGESELYGLEADLRWLATESLTLFAAVGLNQTEFTEFDAVDPLLTGNEFPFAPEYQVTLGALLRMPSGLFLSADISHTDGSFSDTANGPSERLPLDNRNDDYLLVNAKLGFDWQGWLFGVYARNLLDEEYTTRISRGDVRSSGEGFAVVGPPRVIGFEVSLDF